MCGHGTIGVVASLAYQQKITTGTHWFETPVGLIKTTLHDDGSCSIQNVPSYRYKKQVEVQVPELGLIRGDNRSSAARQASLALVPVPQGERSYAAPGHRTKFLLSA